MTALYFMSTDEDDEEVAPFLALRTFLVWILSFFKSSRGSEETAAPLLAFKFFIDMFEEEIDDSDEQIPYLGFAALARAIVGGPPPAKQTSPQQSGEELDDEDAAMVPWLGFKFIADSFQRVEKDDDLSTTTSFPATQDDGWLFTRVSHILDFIKSILSFMIAPFSPNREAPAAFKKVPSKSDLNNNDSDIASLAGVRLFTGTKRRSKAQVRLRNTL